jgi:hypothetical protein
MKLVENSNQKSRFILRAASATLSFAIPMWPFPDLISLIPLSKQQFPTPVSVSPTHHYLLF